MVPRFRSIKHFLNARKAFILFKQPVFHAEQNDLSNVYRWTLKDLR